MSNQPIYRLRSIGAGRSSVDENATQHLLASIRIPDALPVGSVIQLEFDVYGQDGKPLFDDHRKHGGGFIRINDEGRMEFDGT